MNAERLLTELRAAFPQVEKPEPQLLKFHKEGCIKCDLEIDGLNKYGCPLPDEAIRNIRMDMSCLSPEGWRWILPYYLDCCIRNCAGHIGDNSETEFLIYNLRPEPQHEKDQRQQLSLLTAEQFEFLLVFLDEYLQHEEWAEYWIEDIGKAKLFVRSLLLERSEVI